VRSKIVQKKVACPSYLRRWKAEKRWKSSYSFSMQENIEMFVEVVSLFNGHVGNNINHKI